MSDLILYKKMYTELFHAITAAVFVLDLARSELRDTAGTQKEKALEEKIELVIMNLRKAQQKAEQIYIEN